MATTIEGATHYTPEDFKREARAECTAHAKREGNGRPFGIKWEIRVTERGAHLLASYVSNGNHGRQAGVYRVAVIL